MLILFYRDALELVIPFAIVVVALIVVDLLFGIEAAKIRAKNGSKERIRMSTALRRTVNKLVEYTCWLILAASLAVAFHSNWIHYAMMSVIIANELFSVVDNYFFVHGKKVVGLKEFFLKLLGQKFDVDTSDIDIKDIEQ